MARMVKETRTPSAVLERESSGHLIGAYLLYQVEPLL